MTKKTTASTKTNFFIWTVYNKPSDYPNDYVVRIFNFNKPTDKVYTAKTLEEVRRFIPQGLYCMERLPGDDPCIGGMALK